MIACIKKNSKYLYFIFDKKAKKPRTLLFGAFLPKKKKELKGKFFVKMNFCISRTCKSIFYRFKCF